MDFDKLSHSYTHEKIELGTSTPESIEIFENFIYIFLGLRKCVRHFQNTLHYHLFEILTDTLNCEHQISNMINYLPHNLKFTTSGRLMSDAHLLTPSKNDR